jgi:hypothetical protein
MKKYYTSIKRNGLFKHTKAMDESQKNYTEWKKTVLKNVPYTSIYIKF